MQDIVAVNIAERAFATGIICLGAIAYALLFGTIGSVVVAMNTGEHKYLEKVDAVNAYMKELRLPEALRVRRGRTCCSVPHCARMSRSCQTC